MVQLHSLSQKMYIFTPKIFILSRVQGEILNKIGFCMAAILKIKYGHHIAHEFGGTYQKMKVHASVDL